VSFKGNYGLILDLNTGAVRSDLTYGAITTDAQAIQRKRKFGLKYSDDDPSLRFSANALAIDEERLILAAGAAHDRRVRIISLAPPFSMICEFNDEDNPQNPPGGSWRVHRLNFAASGKYLIAEYFFAGRGTTSIMRETEIIDTRQWRVVKEICSHKIHSVALSPDGEEIAFIQDNLLYIGPSGLKN